MGCRFIIARRPALAMSLLRPSSAWLPVALMLTVIRGALADAWTAAGGSEAFRAPAALSKPAAIGGGFGIARRLEGAMILHVSSITLRCAIGFFPVHVFPQNQKRVHFARLEIERVANP